MPVPSGVSGNMTIAGHNFRIADFSIRFAQDVHDTTGFGTPGNWRTSVAGVRVAEITASGYFLDDVDPNIVFEAANDQVGVTFTATVASGITYSGTMIPETATIGDSINGVPVVSITGRSTGAVTETRP